MQSPNPRKGSQRGSRRVRIEQPPLLVALSEQEAIFIPRRAWRRLKRRILEMPQTSTAWLGLATLLVGVSFTERGEGVVAIAAALGAIGFALAHRAVNRANRKLRRDIAEEMRLYEPEPDR